MKLPHSALFIVSLILSHVALGADFPSKANAIRTNATVSLDDNGKNYRVTLTITEKNADGSVTKLPGIGVNCPFGSAGKTGVITKNEGLLIRLETDSKPGQKDVHCIVSVTFRDATPVESEFSLAVP